jgi:hypothetical protein
VTFVNNYEVGYRYDKVQGQLTHVGRTGYVVHLPIVTEVHTIDTRPMQVCINANARVLNCKLVQFDPAGLDQFVAWHGRNDYDNDPGQNGTPSTLNSILMSYAFEDSGRCGTDPAHSNYSFLKVIRALKPEEAAPVGTVSVSQ